jgi:hypothetical protein
MSNRTILMIGFIILFCVVFPSARVEHIFTGRFGMTPQPTPNIPNPTPTQRICTNDATSDTIDHTVCGGVTTYLGDQLRAVFGQIGRNINENLITVGIGSNPDEASNRKPTPSASSIIITTFPYGLIYGAGFGTPNNLPVPTQVIKPTLQPTAMVTQAPSATPQKLVTLTVTRVASPVQTAVPQATEAVLPTSEPTSVPTAMPTVEPTISVTTETTTAATTIILPRNILDGFRTHMPPKGYWQSSADGVYLAVGSFRYLRSYYGADAPDKQRFVTLSITVKNTRGPDGKNIYIDRTNFTMIDLDGRESAASLGSDDLSLPLQAIELAPGEKTGGQLVFLIHKYSAPAQIIVSVANMDDYLSRVDQTIELRVWPIVQ